MAAMLEHSHGSDEYGPNEAAGSHLLGPHQTGIKNIAQNNIDNNENRRNGYEDWSDDVLKILQNKS